MHGPGPSYCSVESLREFLAVGLGGALGAALRHALGQWASLRWPDGAALATFSVNVVGCGAMGLLFALAERGGLTSGWRNFAIAGLCGGFTTFSAFSRDFVVFTAEGRQAAAWLYLLASVLVSVAACWAGYQLGSA